MLQLVHKYFHPLLDLFLELPCASISYGCCNNHTLSGFTQISSLTVLQVRSLKNKVYWDWFLLESLGQNPFLDFLASKGHLHSWLITPSSIFKAHHSNLSFHLHISSSSSLLLPSHCPLWSWPHFLPFVRTLVGSLGPPRYSRIISSSLDGQLNHLYEEHLAMQWNIFPGSWD